MSELRPTTPAQRPDTARPREVAEPVVEPPSADEIARVERHLVRLPVHSGAVVVDSSEFGLTLVRSPGDGPGLNFGAAPRWPAGDVTDALARFDLLMRHRGEWPTLLVADGIDEPPDLARQLPDLGWIAASGETVLWVGGASVVPHLDPSLRVEQVQPNSVADHEALEARIFGIAPREAPRRRSLLAEALERGSVRAYLVRVGREPVAVARLSRGEGVAGLYAIGVAEDWRRRGFASLITAIATRAGLVLGNRIVWLSVEDGNVGARRVYERQGYRPLFHWGRWVRRAR